jgi:hypothetical protein
MFRLLALCGTTEKGVQLAVVVVVVVVCCLLFIVAVVLAPLTIQK